MKQWRADLARIWRQLRGIEAAFGVGLFVLWPLCISFWVGRASTKYSKRLIEIYVVVVLVLTIGNWGAPSISRSIVMSYFTISSVYALLQVVFLTKVVGDIESPERSLLLFMLNVAQTVFMFAAWYELEEPCAAGKALFQALVVLATAGYPECPGWWVSRFLSISSCSLYF